MSEVLDQSEVAALLAAVDSGQVAQQPDSPPQVSPPKGRSDVQLYDFRRPERVSKDQIRTLEALHEGFARNLGTALSSYLRTMVEVSVAHIEQLTYSEFIHSLPNPTCFCLLKAEELDGQVCLEISPLIIYPMIDRLLGGSSADLFIPQRPLTQIEQRLVQRITDRITQHLSEAWSSLTPATFKVEGLQSNPKLVQIVPPNETVILVGFELKMGNRAGTMSLCIPCNVIEPVMSKLAAQTWASYQRKGASDDHLRWLTSSLHSARIGLRAVLAQTSIRVSDLMSMQPGDLITTEKDSGGDVLIEVEGRGKFLGQVGQFRGSRAVRITRVCQPAEAAPAEAAPAKAAPAKSNGAATGDRP